MGILVDGDRRHDHLNNLYFDEGSVSATSAGRLLFWLIAFHILRFWKAFKSDFAIYDLKTIRKSRAVAMEHIEHARRCVFGA
jgi:hypothetical protein